jgi:hypothetical protein
MLSPDAYPEGEGRAESARHVYSLAVTSWEPTWRACRSASVRAWLDDAGGPTRRQPRRTSRCPCNSSRRRRVSNDGCPIRTSSMAALASSPFVARLLLAVSPTSNRSPSRSRTQPSSRLRSPHLALPSSASPATAVAPTRGRPRRRPFAARSSPVAGEGESRSRAALSLKLPRAVVELPDRSRLSAQRAGRKTILFCIVFY